MARERERTVAERGRARPCGCPPGGEDGFGLPELMVAVGIMFMSLTALAYTATTGLVDVAFARQRQSATGLANQTLEKMRALPFETMAKGLDRTDLASGADPRVTSVAGPPIVYEFEGESIPYGDYPSDPAHDPLVPHQRPQTVGPTTYTISAYVTEYEDGPPPGTVQPGVLRGTAVVSWSNPVRPGIAGQVKVQSIFYAPIGCQSTAINPTHPFAAPCEPFFYATALVEGGSITLEGTDPSVPGPVLDDLGLLDAAMALVSASSNLQVEQVLSAQGDVRATGLAFRSQAAPPASAGGTTQSSSASNDPTQKRPAYDAPPSATQATASLTASGPSHSLALSVASGDVTRTISTTAADNTANLCKSGPAPGVDQADGLPCGRGETTQTGTVAAELNLGGGLGLTELAAVTGATAGPAYTNRDLVGSAGMCTGTSGAGCVHASHSRRIGAVRLGGLPAGVTAPAGWLGYLVRLSTYSATVAAESGIGGTAPQAPAPGGTISYWDPTAGCELTVGACYSTMALGTAAAPIPAKTVTAGGVEISASLTTGGTTTVDQIDPTCTVTPCARVKGEARSGAPILGEVSYVTAAGSFRLAVNLGALSARTSYAKAPGA